MCKSNCKSECYCQHKFVALLDGYQENPKIQTPAYGKVKATLVGHDLNIKGSFENLSGDYVASHLHLSIAGRNGAVIFDLPAKLDDTKRNGKFCRVFVLSDSQVKSLLDREIYINVHSTVYPSGEIRGQLLHKACKYYISNLSGVNEVPNPISGSQARGTILYELDDDHNLTATGSFNNLSSAVTVAHIHRGYSGVSGPVLFPFTLAIDVNNLGGVIKAQSNCFSLSCDQQKWLNRVELYANVHSVNYPAGELRDQIHQL